MRRTKIVCTLGPASRTREKIEQLVRAGMNVARINFSHGTHEQHAEVIGRVREVSAKLGKPIAILQDLSGPKLRLGIFEAVTLKRGQEVGFSCLDLSFFNEGEKKEKETLNRVENLILPLPIPEMLSALTPQSNLLLDDGKISLKVTRCTGEPGTPHRTVWARCIVGGELKPRKGVTSPGLDLSLPSVTEKDKDDLRFGLSLGVDWVAVSYVRKAEDLEPLKEIIREAGLKVPLIAKIEMAEAVENIHSLINAVSGIMVARGDLGVEMPFDRVPLVQKEIIRLCNRAGKPVITATQMLESMISNPRPTRAEATDVANAILDGTDAVMLSGETAAGEFPVEAVRTMAKIATSTERALDKDGDYERRLRTNPDVTEAVAHAVVVLAEQIKAKAILCATTSGSTARSVAQYRPKVLLLGVTNDEKTYRKLTLTWGVTPALIPEVSSTDEMLNATLDIAVKMKFVAEGDTVVLTAGVPVNNPGTTNLIKVHKIGQPITFQKP